jgi:hypothetical protein
MPKPASIQKPNFDIVAWNDSFGHLMGVDFNEIPPEDRNCIYLFLTHPAWRARLGKRDDVLPILSPISARRWPSTGAIRCGKPNWRASLRCLRSLKPCGTSATTCAAWKTSSSCSPIRAGRFYAAADVLVFRSAKRVAAAGVSAGG